VFIRLQVETMFRKLGESFLIARENLRLIDEQKANAVKKGSVDASTLLAKKLYPWTGQMEQNACSGTDPGCWDPEILMIEQKKLTDKLLHYAPHLMGVFVAVLLVHDIFGTHGYRAMRQKQQEIQKVRQDLEKLDKENQALQQNVQDLKSDPDTIRKIAREEYGLAGRDEKIIKLPAQKPAAPQVGKP